MKKILVIVLLLLSASPIWAAEKPNIVFILGDDLGYADLGCYGQKQIKTPRLDQMAAEGIRFTDFYAGATVCAPSRSVLMTGQHLGHCHVRGNAGGEMLRQSLRDEDVTVAEAIRSAGYRSALIGKWGLGEVGQPGHPLSQGFDYFFGYLNQVHAHNYWPDHLYRGNDRVDLPNVVQLAPRMYGGFHSGWATKKVVYSQDLFAKEALQWVEATRAEPFFLYLALTLPHANNEAAGGVGNGSEVPDHGIYADQDWPDPDKGQAAMISYMDRDVGRLLDRLTELGLAENTLVMFSSDNGPHMESRNDPLRFDPSGPLRGMKRDLFEGGIRVPMIAWWPGTITPNQVSNHVGYFGDLMATACELAGVETPPNTDSISFLPTLLGKPDEQQEHEYLYWEFYEGDSAQAVRWGNWKAIRSPMLSGRIEVYDLSRDPGEKYNLYRRKDLVNHARELMQKAHMPHPNWTLDTK
ncbi:arylsulfatase [Crateriforma conspicua]|uniref:Arylsulfatase n=1 Tax=Crateriforma conspicua TaxID=2527996 RepID=A0A5C6FTS8_9PLAN|nr:arylsulfatase [Crateriforma conspicua]TWU64603.1 Arylsulfatase [Crateriforma conspicua]